MIISIARKILFFLMWKEIKQTDELSEEVAENQFGSIFPLCHGKYI